MSTKEDAARLFAPGSTTFMVTVGDDGRPDARAMCPVLNEGLKTIWMLTGKCSDKFRQLSANPQCLLYATDLEDNEAYMELRLWGSVELLDDAASREKAWLEDYKCYFPAGKDDPNLSVLKFTATSGMLQTREKKEPFTL